MEAITFILIAVTDQDSVGVLALDHDTKNNIKEREPSCLSLIYDIKEDS